METHTLHTRTHSHRGNVDDRHKLHAKRVEENKREEKESSTEMLSNNVRGEMALNIKVTKLLSCAEC